MNEIVVLYVFVLGLMIGSFLNVLIYRYPLGESIISPGSHCRVCNHSLRPWELIPVFSYFILGRRCSQCKTAISPRYAGVELLTGLLFLLIYLLRPDPIEVLILHFLFVSLLLILSFVDLDTFRLPDVLVLMVGISGVMHILLSAGAVLWTNLLGAVFAGGIFYLIYILYPNGLGFGDVKFVVALGLYLGLPEVFFAIFLGSLLGVMALGFGILIGKQNPRDPVPFGPLLSAGAVFVLLMDTRLSQLFGF